MTEIYDYGNAVLRARRIASHDPLSAPPAVAEAIVRCAEHGLWAQRDSSFSGRIGMTYRNWFGPTCTVDDVFERMTMREWKLVFQGVISLVLHGEIRDEDCPWRPSVTARPELGTDIISEVKLEAAVPADVADGVVEFLEKRREATYGRKA